jgi:hypothetical protein
MKFNPIILLLNYSSLHNNSNKPCFTTSEANVLNISRVAKRRITIVAYTTLSTTCHVRSVKKITEHIYAVMTNNLKHTISRGTIS